MLTFRPSIYLNYYEQKAQAHNGNLPESFKEDYAGIDEEGRFIQGEQETSWWNIFRGSRNIYRLVDIVKRYFDRQKELASYPEFAHVTPIAERQISRWPMTISQCYQLSYSASKESMSLIHEAEIELLSAVVGKRDPAGIQKAANDLVTQIMNCLHHKTAVGEAWKQCAADFLGRQYERVREECRKVLPPDRMQELEEQMFPVMDYVLDGLVEDLSHGIALEQDVRAVDKAKQSGIFMARAGFQLERLLDALTTNREEAFVRLVFQFTRNIGVSLMKGELPILAADNYKTVFDGALESWGVEPADKERLKEQFRNGTNCPGRLMDILATLYLDENGKSNPGYAASNDLKNSTKTLMQCFPVLMNSIMEKITDTEKEAGELVRASQENADRDPEAYKIALKQLWLEDALS